MYSKNPTSISSNTDLIQVDDIFANALINFVLYRAYLKDGEFAGNQQRAGSYYQLFTASLARGGVIQQAVQPNQGVSSG